MTNEEAIKTLKANYPDACVEQLREAVDAAIEALKAQDAAGDTISRAAAIDFVDDVPYIKDHPNIGLLWKAWVEQLPPAQPEPHWIPCKERMPEKGQKCLVCDKGTIAIDTFIGNGKPYDWRWYMRDYEAWMPLPEGYKEAEE